MSESTSLLSANHILEQEVIEMREKKKKEEDSALAQKGQYPMTLPSHQREVNAQDFEGNGELESASMLTMPLSVPTSARKNESGSKVEAAAVTGFGENLSIEAILNSASVGSGGGSQHPTEGSQQSGMHQVSSKNIIAFADVLKCELQDKQRMIDSLLEEVKEKTHAVQVVGQDIRQLRDEKMVMQNQIKFLQQEVKKHEQGGKEAVERAREERIKLKSSEGRDPIMLQNLVKNLSKRIEELTSEKILLEGHISEKDRVIEEAKELAEKYVQVQDAQLKSNQYITSIKKEIAKIDHYKVTIQTQERVIGKLQSVMESKLKSKFSFMKDDNATLFANNSLIPPPNPFPMVRSQSVKESEPQPLLRQQSSVESLHADSLLLEKTKEENAQFQDKIRILEEQVIELQKQNRDLEKSQKTSSTRPSSAKSTMSAAEEEEQDDAVDDEGQRPSNVKGLKAANLKIDKLIAENISKKFRIEALERQLEASARDSAKEIARLRTKLFELEISLSLLTNNNDEDEEEDDDEEEDGTEDDSNTNSEANSRPVTTSGAPAKAEAVESGKASARKEEVKSAVDDKEDKKDSKDEDKQEKEKTEEAKSGEKKSPPLTARGGELTKQDSVVDIDRIPTPPEVDRPAPNEENVEKKAEHTDEDTSSLAHSASTKSIKKKISLDIPDGMIERTLVLYDYGDDKIQDHESSMDTVSAGVAAEASVSFHHHKEVTATGVNHIFRLDRVKVSNFPNDDIQSRFSVYCTAYVYFRFMENESQRLHNNHHRFHHLHKAVWNIDTPQVKAPGATIQWDHDNSQPAEEKTFTITEDALSKFCDPDDPSDENGVKLKLSFKKVSAKSQEDFTLGIGTTSLFFLPKSY